MMNARTIAAAAATLLLAGGACGERVDERPADTAAAVTTPAPGALAGGATQRNPEMRIEVNVDARELYVYRNDQREATHRVAVGSAEWPTERGEWNITQVVWNPEWIPPDQEWAEERERKAPGDPDNPLGRAQLIYDPPRTIHGTNNPGSIGQAVSHGSIRVSNDVATQLARQVMEAAGAGRDEAWYRRAQENRTEKQVVDLPNPIPIRVF